MPNRLNVLPRSLTTQLALLVSLLFAASLFSLAWYTTREQSLRMEAVLEDQSRSLAQNIAANALGPLGRGDLSALEGVLRQSVSFPNVAAIVVTDAAGHAVVRVNRGEGGAIDVDRSGGGLALSLPTGDQRARIDTSGANPWDSELVVWQAVGNDIGWVRLRVSLREVVEAGRRAWFGSLVVALAAIVLGTFAVLLFLARPVGVLRRAADFAGQLDRLRGESLPLFSGNEEVRQLIEALNRASRRLKQQEERIEGSNRFLKSLTDALGEGVIATDAMGCCTFVNQEAERLLGWPRDELQGKVVHDLVHFQTMTGFRVAREECPLHSDLGARHVFRSDLDVFTRRDGSQFPVSVVSMPVFEGEQFVGAVMAFQDVSARKRDEEFLLATSSRLSALIESMQAGVLVEDERGVIVVSNRALCEIFALEQSSAELVGMRGAEVLPGCRERCRDPETFAALTRELVANRIPLLGQELDLVDGRVLEFDYVPIYLFPSMPQPEDCRGQVCCSAISPNARWPSAKSARRARQPRWPIVPRAISSRA